MTDKLSSKEARDLCQAMRSLQTAKDFKNFLRDLCTLSELESMIERFQVAKMIKNNIPYRTINKKLGVSTTTITRVAHWYHHGMGGYQAVLDHTH